MLAGVTAETFSEGRARLVERAGRQRYASATSLGVPAALRSAGWDEAALARYAPLVEGEGTPPVEPGRMVVTLGARDDITPHAEGLKLVREWRVPAANLFARPRGHYSTSLALLRAGGPFRRRAEVVGRGG